MMNEYPCSYLCPDPGAHVCNAAGESLLWVEHCQLQLLFHVRPLQACLSSTPCLDSPTARRRLGSGWQDGQPIRLMPR